MRIANYISLFLLFFFISCVGTVQESTVPENKLSTGKNETFNFLGIVTGRPVAHNKIEIEFAPSSSDVKYLLYLNDAKSPIELDPNSLISATAGRVMYTVANLETNREYKLKLSAINTKTNAQSKNENIVYLKTFDNPVAEFLGVAQLNLTPGNRTSSIDIGWIPPKMTGLFTATEYDPVCYQVTYISDVGGPANLNNPNYNGNDKKTFYVPDCMRKNPAPEIASPASNPSSFTLNPVNSNTRYYIQVRAINKLYYDFIKNNITPEVDVDSNTKFLSIRTQPGGNEFYFEGDKVVLKNAPALEAATEIDVFWPEAAGVFDSYRIFYRRYDGAGDPLSDDQLTEAVLNVLNTPPTESYRTATPMLTTTRLSGLNTNEWYQVKVALCKTSSCPLASSNPNGAIISEMKAIQVKMKLASFSGINLIENPGQFSENDMVNLKFDPPIISDGYATDLEFYCVNPANHTDMVKLNSNTPITGSSIPQCNNLFLEINDTIDLSTYKIQKVKGVTVNGQVQYCFAATPAVTGYGPEIRILPENRIVRCSYPEVTPPTLEQFPGLTNSCSITGRVSSLTWNLPNGGIYSGFKVFWKEKIGGAIFSFKDAIAGVAGYSSQNLNADVVNFDVPQLIPGKTYQFGVLAVTDMPAPLEDLYSEYNLNVIECNLPLPIASFKSFSRIFAIGPKLDGRIPNNALTKAPPAEAAIFEAINADGIPYEVAMQSTSSPDLNLNFKTPPGRDAGGSFASLLDGKRGSTNYAMSNSGIISLAWEEISFPTTDIQQLFEEQQPASNTDRATRKWGYRIYRSTDNQLTWTNISSESGVIMSMPFSYRKRINTAPTATRMAFFTDYSVKAVEQIHNVAATKDIERARIYYYKIVPVFDGKELSYVANSKHNIVRVTLPPANMALVHRWMANRNHCLEMDKTLSQGDHYSCTYNGIGAVGKQLPYRSGNTKFDQGGDLLVDRYELGCRFTRGDINPDIPQGASYYNRESAPNRVPGRDNNNYPLFQGLRTFSDETVDDTVPFRGCVGSNSLASSKDTPVGYSPAYHKFNHGDCSGSSGARLFYRKCEATEAPTHNIYDIPGLPLMDSMADCLNDSNTSASNANSVQTMILNPTIFLNYVLHGEFLAVYYNQVAQNSSYGTHIYGPDPADPTKKDKVISEWSNYSSQCSINLASIDAGVEGYMRPRWVDINRLSSDRLRLKGEMSDVLNMTVDQISEVHPSGLYNGLQSDPASTAAFRLPDTKFRTSPRYRGTTRIGKIMTSNSAKLPPITKIQQKVAQSLCEVSAVQVGIANDADIFAAIGPIISKRPIRRTESVTAAAWPEHFDETTVNNLEASVGAGSCNSAAKNVTGLTQLDRMTQIHNHATVRNLQASASVDIPLLSGSSPYNTLSTNNETYHSEKCNSRYGIQDLIGNVSEANSEHIFCDYSEDRIFLGPVESVWGGGEEAVNRGDGDPTIDFFNSDEERERWMVLHQGPGNTTFTIKFTDKPDILTALDDRIRPWIKRSPNSGYCSVVDSIATRRAGLHNFYDGSGNWSNIFLPGGALNSSVVNRPQPDQLAVNRMRYGDGFFLDFGPEGLLPALNFKNTNALTSAETPSPDRIEAQGKYFNPVVGFPVKCSGSSCDNPMVGEIKDIHYLTTENLEPNITTLDTEAAVADFPVGNSTISNTGISGFNYPAAGAHLERVQEAQSLYPMYVLTEVTLNPAGAVVDKKFKTFPDEFNLGDELLVHRVVWDVQRGSNLFSASGGSAKDSLIGRYSSDINISHGSADKTARGVRCAVMINED